MHMIKLWSSSISCKQDFVFSQTDSTELVHSCLLLNLYVWRTSTKSWTYHLHNFFILCLRVFSPYWIHLQLNDAAWLWQDFLFKPKYFRLSYAIFFSLSTNYQHPDNVRPLSNICEFNFFSIKKYVFQLLIFSLPFCPEKTNYFAKHK